MELELTFLLIFLVLILVLGAIRIYVTKEDFTEEFKKDVLKELKIKDDKKLLTFNKKKFTKTFTIKNYLLTFVCLAVLFVLVYLFMTEIISLVTFIWMLVIFLGTLTLYYLLTQYDGGLYQNLIIKDDEIDYVTISYTRNTNGINKKVQKVEFKKVYDFTIGKAHINVNGIMEYTTTKNDKIKKDEIIFYSIPRIFDEEDKIKEKLREMKKNH